MTGGGETEAPSVTAHASVVVSSSRGFTLGRHPAAALNTGTSSMLFAGTAIAGVPTPPPVIKSTSKLVLVAPPGANDVYELSFVSGSSQEFVFYDDP
jgi:hypothetical protein